MAKPRFMVTLAVVCLTAMFSGCGDGNPRNCTLSGRVSIDGVPVQEGQISFQQVEEGDLPSGSMILEGRYQTDVTPGKKIVQISASDPSIEVDQAAGGLAADIVPQKYIDNPPEIDIKKSGTHDFIMTSD